MKTKYSKISIVFLLSTIIFATTVGTIVLLNIDFNEKISIFHFLPFVLFSISLLKLAELLNFKEFNVDNEYLMVRYLFFKKTQKIKLNSIEKVRVSNSGHETFSFGIYSNIGKRIELFSSNKKITTQSFYYENFEKLFVQIQQNIPVRVKNEMVSVYNLKEDKYSKNNLGIVSRVLRFVPLIFLLIWIYLSQK